jgi:hypothetical protein
MRLTPPLVQSRPELATIEILDGALEATAIALQAADADWRENGPPPDEVLPLFARALLPQLTSLREMIERYRRLVLTDRSRWGTGAANSCANHPRVLPR